MKLLKKLEIYDRLGQMAFIQILLRRFRMRGCMRIQFNWIQNILNKALLNFCE